ncbi:MAG: hypothetical protein LQ351_005385 [Letrouitia transgressa]|nr:MAG: hypothetical protein LQ351_005385 [Letrouitia transgressa]
MKSYARKPAPINLKDTAGDWLRPTYSITDVPASSMKVPLSSGDSSASLTAIATQERRVLELKDELQKAENELQRLKKQWALQQATRKRNETRHSEPLQPLRTDDFQTLKEKELESDHDSTLSPKTTSSSSTKEGESQSPHRRQNSQHSMRPHRRVFSGSRSTRALSLLSPKPSSVRSSFSDHVERPRSSVDQLDEHFPAKSPADSQRPAKSMTKEPFLETGKQLVDEFRDGLRNLFEDLRQVTVGTEAMNSLDHRAKNMTINGAMTYNDHKGSTDNAINARDGPNRTMTPERGKVGKSTSIAKSIPNDKYSSRTSSPTRFGPSSKISQEQQDLMPKCNDSDDEGWENWDSPAAKAPASQTFSKPLYP